MFKLYLLFVLNLKPPAMCSSDFNKYKEIPSILIIPFQYTTYQNINRDTLDSILIQYLK